MHTMLIHLNMTLKLDQVFESLDADGSGELTMVEVQAAFRVQVSDHVCTPQHNR